LAQFNVPQGKTVHTTRYTGFTGVDFNSDDEVISKTRFPYAQNLIIDDNGYPDKRPGFEEINFGDYFGKCCMASGKIKGKEYIALIGENSGFIVFSREDIEKIKSGEQSQTYVNKNIKPSGNVSIKNINDGFLIKFKSDSDNDGFYFYDGEKLRNLHDEAYVPTTVVGRNYSSYFAGEYTLFESEIKTDPGNVYEEVNLLTRKRRNCFSHKFSSEYPGESTSGIKMTILHLDGDIDNNHGFTVEYYYSGEWLTIDIEQSKNYNDGVSISVVKEVDNGNYTISVGNNSIAFSTKKGMNVALKKGEEIIKLPLRNEASKDKDEINDNIRITFYAATDDDYEDKLKECDIMTTYGISDGDRVWLSGNDSYKNYVWYSEFNNKFYFPDMNYCVVGSNDTAVLGFSNYKNYLVVHKESNKVSPTLFIMQGSIDSDGNALFTVKSGISGIGAVSKTGFCMADDEPLILTKQGVFGLTVENINSETCLKNRSYFLDPMLTKEDLSTGHLFEYKNYILCSNGNGKIYVMQKNFKNYVNSSQSYVFECMLWTDIEAQCFCEFDGDLFFLGDGKLRRLKKREETPGYFNDTTTTGEKGIDAYFLTVADDDSTFMTLKTMVKRGCGIMLKPYEQSSVTVSVIKDRDASREIKSHRFGYFDFEKIYFETFDFRSSKASEIVPFNSKVKKYSTLQFMVRNNRLSEGFGIIGIEKRYVFGNYKKS
jgi:hypothetical protein